MADQIGTGKWTDSFHAYRDDIITKIKKGSTEESIPIGGSEFTQSEWKKVLSSVDKQLEDIKEEQEERIRRQTDTSDAQKIYEIRRQTAFVLEM